MTLMTTFEDLERLRNYIVIFFIILIFLTMILVSYQFFFGKNNLIEKQLKYNKQLFILEDIGKNIDLMQLCPNENCSKYFKARIDCDLETLKQV